MDGNIRSLQTECKTDFKTGSEAITEYDICSKIDDLSLLLLNIVEIQKSTNILLINLNTSIMLDKPPAGILYNENALSSVATVTQPESYETLAIVGTPDIPGYDQHQIHQILKRNSPSISIVNDGASTIYILSSSDGKGWSASENVIFTGEAREFYDIYELRVRCPVANNAYRVTEYNYELAYAAFVTPNREPYIASERNIGLLIAPTNITAVIVPNGYALVIRADPNNTVDVFIATSALLIAAVATRGTLAPGDSLKMFVTNANLLWLATTIINQNVDIYVEQ